tara:strand:- start:863 stop:1156 length:294 start_codon:yes stop_codon:yes gene_type:complete
MINIIEAIKKINPNAEVTVNDDDYNQITWLNGTTPISIDDIKTKQTELQTAYNNSEYQRKRKSEYPSIADQLDDLYHNGIDGWKATIKITKDKWSKP